MFAKIGLATIIVAAALVGMFSDNMPHGLDSTIIGVLVFVALTFYT